VTTGNSIHTYDDGRLEAPHGGRCQVPSWPSRHNE